MFIPNQKRKAEDFSSAFRRFHPNDHAFAALQAPNRGESLTNFHPKYLSSHGLTNRCHDAGGEAVLGGEAPDDALAQ
jgi:hypothetical protein